MATSFVSVTILALWLWLVAATIPTSTWAIRDLVEFEDEPTTDFNTHSKVITLIQLLTAFRLRFPLTSTLYLTILGPSRFNVQIINTSNSAIRKIMVNCGAFASAIPIDPNVFKRVGDGPFCIVNNGNAMASRQALSFTYEQKSIQPLSLASAECVP